jgi:hypothetical protein
LTLSSPLGLSQGGTGATSASSALTNILPTGTTAGYVLTTGGPGNFYWSASGGGGGGATPEQPSTQQDCLILHRVHK